MKRFVTSTKIKKLFHPFSSQCSCKPICAASFPSARGIIHHSGKVTWQQKKKTHKQHISLQQSNQPLVSLDVEERDAVVYLIIRTNQSWEQSFWQMHVIMKLKRVIIREGRKPTGTCILYNSISLLFFHLSSWGSVLYCSVCSIKAAKPRFFLLSPFTWHQITLLLNFYFPMDRKPDIKLKYCLLTRMKPFMCLWETFRFNADSPSLWSCVSGFSSFTYQQLIKGAAKNRNLLNPHLSISESHWSFRNTAWGCDIYSKFPPQIILKGVKINNNNNKTKLTLFK